MMPQIKQSSRAKHIVNLLPFEKMNEGRLASADVENQHRSGLLSFLVHLRMRYPELVGTLIEKGH